MHSVWIGPLRWRDLTVQDSGPQIGILGESQAVGWCSVLPELDPAISSIHTHTQHAQQQEERFPQAVGRLVVRGGKGDKRLQGDGKWSEGYGYGRTIVGESCSFYQTSRCPRERRVGCPDGRCRLSLRTPLTFLIRTGVQDMWSSGRSNQPSGKLSHVERRRRLRR
jgi:hypothetical protein